MTIELRVKARTQTSPMSCWWACMAMVLEYYGHNYILPSQYRESFRRPFFRPLSPSLYTADRHYATGNQLQNMPLEQAEGHTYLEPYEWYDHGLPGNRHAFSLLSRITGFQGFSRPAFGRWTADDFKERLENFGPYVFMGFWNGFPHAILVIGVVQNASSTNIISIDPARGFAASESLSAFNARMRSQSMIEYTFNNLNPLYLPQTNPIRGTINHD